MHLACNAKVMAGAPAITLEHKYTLEIADMLEYSSRNKGIRIPDDSMEPQYLFLLQPNLNLIDKVTFPRVILEHPRTNQLPLATPTGTRICMNIRLA